MNRIVVQKALNKSWSLDNKFNVTKVNPLDGEGSLISRMIYDIFGGEILKTHKKQGWHFYNRINGKRIDFTKSEMRKSSPASQYAGGSTLYLAILRQTRTGSIPAIQFKIAVISFPSSLGIRF